MKWTRNSLPNDTVFVHWLQSFPHNGFSKRFLFSIHLTTLHSPTVLFCIWCCNTCNGVGDFGDYNNLILSNELLKLTHYYTDWIYNILQSIRPLKKPTNFTEHFRPLQGRTWCHTSWVIVPAGCTWLWHQPPIFLPASCVPAINSVINEPSIISIRISQSINPFQH